MKELDEIKEKLDQLQRELDSSNQKAIRKSADSLIMDTLAWCSILFATFFFCYSIGKML